jgi:hypothetical protein
MDGEICLGTIVVAKLSEAFFSDGVWYAKFRQVVSEMGDEHETRAAHYVAFSVEWNARVKAGAAADAAQFAMFSDLIKWGKWTARLGGVVQSIEQAPVFYPDGDVSWRATTSSA